MGFCLAVSSPKSTVKRAKRPSGIGVGILYSIESINLLTLGHPVAFMVLSKQAILLPFCFSLTTLFGNKRSFFHIDSINLQMINSSPKHETILQKPTGLGGDRMKKI